MSNKYKLVNPYIKGDFETTLDARNSIEAAREFYKNLSEHFNNNVPRFYFTLQKGGKGKFYHFEVKEKKSTDDVNYSISPFEIKNEADAIKGFTKSFKNFKGRYNGGAKSHRKGSRKGSHRKGSKSSIYKDYDDSSEDFYRETKSYIATATQPIYYMYYDPLLYRMDSVFIPGFNPYLTPYVELNLAVGQYTYYTSPGIGFGLGL